MKYVFKFDLYNERDTLVEVVFILLRRIYFQKKHPPSHLFLVNSSHLFLKHERLEVVGN